MVCVIMARRNGSRFLFLGQSEVAVLEDPVVSLFKTDFDDERRRVVSVEEAQKFNLPLLPIGVQVIERGTWKSFLVGEITGN